MKNCAAVICAASRLLEFDVAVASHRHWSRLRMATRHLHELLVEDIAEDAEQTATRRLPEPRWCDVDTLVRAVTDRLRARAADAGVVLAVSCDGGSILADRAALDEALFNLVANAVEATPCGGRVSFEARRLENGDQQWRVRDTGHGIPEDQLSRMGRPCATRKAGGSGIGFAIARAAIARHGGMLRIESSGPTGTAIGILLAERADGRCSQVHLTEMRLL
jgi:two-component system sensor histidine kinase VicK